MYGRDCFIDNLDDANVTMAIQEGRNQNMQVGLRTAEPRLINNIRDISFFEGRFTRLMEIYANIKNLKQEEEEINLSRQRLCTYLRKDLLQFQQQVCKETEGTTATAVVKDLIDQLANLNKRLLDIKVMGDSEPNIPPLPFTEYDPLDGSLRNIKLSVGQFIQKIRKKLLELKEHIHDKKREDENRQKILLQERLRLGPGRLK